MNIKNTFIILTLLLIVSAVSIFVLNNNKTQTNLDEFPKHTQQDPEKESNESADSVSGTPKLDEYEKLTFLNNTLDTSDWKTYRNEEFGFEVRYPKNWEVKDEIEKHSRFILLPTSRQGPDDRGTYVSISDKTLEEFKQNASIDPNNLEFVGNFFHNGMTGVIVEAKLGVWNKSYPFPDEREIIKQYTFDTGNHRLMFYSPSTDDNFSSIFEQILLSFKLIK